MSAPISTSTNQSTGLAGADAARPQVQSRRVSLKLGPLGITYATDQVLWTEAVASAATAAVQGGAGAAAETAAEQAQATQEAQAGRSFSQELLAARQRQAQQQSRSGQTYGPGGSLAGPVGGEEAAKTEAQDAPEAAGQDAGQSPERQSSPQAQAAPGSRVRRAIAAYLACACDYRSARPMLSAVA